MQFALAAGIADRDKAASYGAALGGEQQQRRGEFVERLDPDHAIAIEQGVIGKVAAGERAGMRQRRGARRRRAADLKRDDGHATLGGALERQGEARRIARRLDENADDLHLRPLDRIERCSRRPSPSLRRRARRLMQSAIADRYARARRTRCRNER